MKTNKSTSLKWAIRVNGGYFDGIAGGRSLAQAKRYTKHEAQVLNRVLMCGNGKVVLA